MMLRSDTRRSYIKQIISAVQKLMDDGYIQHIEASDKEYMRHFSYEVRSMTDYELTQTRKDFCNE
jgi:hypothetical protein